MDLPVAVLLGDLNDADVYRVAARHKLVVDHALHEMRLLLLPEAQPGVAQAHVLTVVLARELEVALTSHVVAPGAAEQERLSEVVQVGGYGLVVYGHTLHGFQGTAYLVGVCQGSDRGAEVLDKLREICLCAHVWSTLSFELENQSCHKYNINYHISNE